jgi:hypothetical protein
VEDPAEAQRILLVTITCLGLSAEQWQPTSRGLATKNRSRCSAPCTRVQSHAGMSMEPYTRTNKCATQRIATGCGGPVILVTALFKVKLQVMIKGAVDSHGCA